MGGFYQNTSKPRYIPQVVKHEESIQRRVASYIKKHYPHVYFRSDTASGMKLSEHQRMVHHSQQSGPSQPDMMIFYPSRGYYGLLLELKKDGTTIIVSRGSNKGKLTSNPHIQQQAAVLRDMAKLGYCARFAVGYDQAIRIINWYMENENASLF